jgi:hypothetical protein
MSLAAYAVLGLIMGCVWSALRTIGELVQPRHGGDNGKIGARSLAYVPWQEPLDCSMARRMTMRILERPRVIVWQSIAGSIAVGAVLSALAPGFARGADDDSKTYRVQVVQPLKIGDRVHMQRDIAETTSDTVTIDHSERGRQSSGTSELKFTGTLEALAVDKHGVPIRWKVIAETASTRGPEANSHEELVKPGAKFIAEWKGGKVTVTPDDNGAPLSETANKLLPLVFEASGNGEATLNAIVQSAKAEPLGTSWSVNAKAAVDNLREFDSKLKPSDISGTVRLKALVGDTEHKDLSVEYDFKAKSNNPADPPAGMKRAGAATREESGSLIIPADLSTGYLSAKTTIRITGMYKKSDPYSRSEKYQTGPRSTKTITHHFQVPEGDALNRIIKINTVLVYERIGGVDKKSSASPSSGP